MSYFHYSHSSKKFSRTLRNNSTKSEVYLWLLLKNKQLGVRFTRQFSIGDYIVDFYCKELKLAIEIDGDYHYDNQEKDILRQEYLEKRGITVLRYRTEDVEKNAEGVASLIKEWVDHNG